MNSHTQTINLNQIKIPLTDSETLELLNTCKKFAGSKKPNCSSSETRLRYNMSEV